MKPGSPQPGAPPEPVAPPQAPEISGQRKSDAEQRRAGIEVGTNFKKVIDAYRIYRGQHEALPALEAQLWKKARHFLDEFGDLAFELSSMSVSIEGKAVVSTENQAESIAYPLFAEGIHEIVVAAGIDEPEFLRFVRIWANAMVDTDADRTVLTQFWEGDFSYVELISMGASNEDEDDGESSERSAALQRAMSSIAGQISEFGASMDRSKWDHSYWSADSTPTTAYEGPRLPVDDQASLRLLAAELSLPIQAADIDAPPAPKTFAVDDEAMAALRWRLENIKEHDIPRRFIDALYCVAANAGPNDVEAMVEPFAGVLALIVNNDGAGQVATWMKNAQAIARGRARDPNYAHDMFTMLLTALERPVVFDALLEKLDGEQTRNGAAHMLALVRPEAVSVLIKALHDMDNAASITTLLHIIFGKRPHAEDLANCAQAAPPVVVASMLKMVSTRTDPVSQIIKNAALSHSEMSIRLRVLDSLTPDNISWCMDALRRLVKDGAPRVRKAATLLLLQVHDRASIRNIAAMVERNELPVEERASFITALGHLGGLEAGLALRKVFTQQKDNGLRAAAAMALAQMNDQSARPLLEKEANKFLHRGQLKAACVEALRRLDGAPPRRPSGESG